MTVKPTVQSIAAELSVSRQTVSNVLNAPHRVHPDTRARVQAVIDRVGYQPSVAARALRNQRSMSIGLRLRSVSDGINGAVMDGFLHALVERAARSGYRIMMFTADSIADEIEQLRQLRESNAIDACVLTDTTVGDTRPQALTKAGVPFAAFGRPWGTDQLHAWVDVDGRAGTADAVRHLLSRGHHRIGFIGWPEVSGVGADRRSGWSTEMSKSLAPGESLLDLEVCADDSVANGALCMRQLISRDVTAVVCASDSLGIGALTELRSSGRNGAVVGFDDTPVARAVGMSSVRQPVAQAADSVIALVLAQLVDPDAVRSQILLAPMLMPRELEGFITLRNHD